MKFPEGMTAKVNCIDKKGLFVNVDNMFALFFIIITRLVEK